jgi:hypothetical protein
VVFKNFASTRQAGKTAHHSRTLTQLKIHVSPIANLARELMQIKTHLLVGVLTPFHLRKKNSNIKTMQFLLF